MNRISRVLVCGSAAFAAICVSAQEEPATEDAAESQDAEVAAVAKPKQEQEKFFFALPMCRLLEGAGEVLKPGSTAWEAIEEGRFYPLGCSYRSKGAASKLSILFGAESEVLLSGDASFGTVVQPLGVKSRTLILQSGTINLKLPRNLPEGFMTVTAPGFSVLNPAGESRYTYSATGDGDVAVVRCVTGSLSIKGRHFSIPEMHAANEIRIRTSQDILFTGLYGTSGDYIVNLDQGASATKDFETGEESVSEKTLAWKLSPQTAVRIHRAVPEIGERMAVTVMTFDSAGGLMNRCAFVEGRPELSTGEQGEAAIQAKEAAAKKAADAAESATVEAEPEPTNTDETSSENEEDDTSAEEEE